MPEENDAMLQGVTRPTPRERWFPARGAAHGVVRVVHGLNNRPSAMDPLIASLNAAGFHALRLSLHDYPAPPGDVARWWCDTLRDGRREARLRAPHLPHFDLGYSLGALVTVESLREDSSEPGAACVFLAPALALTATASLVRLLTPLRRWCPALRSAAPASLRLRDATPLLEYGGMLTLLSRLTRRGVPPRAAATPTLLLMSPADEFVSYRRLSKRIGAPDLERWRLEAVHPDRAVPNHHLLISPERVGAHCWTTIVARTVDHLRAHLT